jgi:uncharacterized protein (DUF1800 family)
MKLRSAFMRLSRRQSLMMMAGAGLSPWSFAGPQAAAMSADQAAFHALNRLGFGPSPADALAIQRLGAEVWLAQFLAQQLQGGASPPEPWAAQLQGMAGQQMSQSELLSLYREAQQAGRAAKLMEGGQGAQQGARREMLRPIVLEASQQRLLRAVHSPGQLEEVLVDFWFNHFNVFAGKGPVGVLVGSYEREAIRPHVFGKFRAMLGATAKHPAMLIYLDNAQSVGPAKPRPNAQKKPPAGLNENYARELMELHTLGVDGGYTQRDVTELARMLTGWTVDYRSAQDGAVGPAFQFDAGRHDKGVKQWLGRAVEPAGQQEGEAALDVLAAHPATARHIAFKLAQAFVADQPPPALVARLSERFVATQGDLRAVMQALLKDEAFWSPQAWGAKFKTPYHYLLSSLRALGLSPVDTQMLLGALAQAGMPLYGAQTPDGYKNVEAAWLNPEALAQRIQWASRVGAKEGLRKAAGAELLPTLGAIIKDSTAQALADEPADLRMALLLASPEFMHR